jgi:ATP-dependent Clp protease ATP-binding subunit ClpB
MTMGKSLQHKRVLSIDLSAIMAGSGIRGQFEEKFKALIRDIEEEVIVIGYGNLQ